MSDSRDGEGRVRSICIIAWMRQQRIRAGADAAAEAQTLRVDAE